MAFDEATEFSNNARIIIKIEKKIKTNEAKCNRKLNSARNLYKETRNYHNSAKFMQIFVKI